MVFNADSGRAQLGEIRVFLLRTPEFFSKKNPGGYSQEYVPIYTSRGGLHSMQSLFSTPYPGPFVRGTGDPAG